MKRLAVSFHERPRPMQAMAVARAGALDMPRAGALDMTRAGEIASSPATPREGLRLDPDQLADVTARAVVVVLFSMMAIRFGADFLATGRLNGLLLLVSEALVVALTVIRRSAAIVDRSLQARLLTALSMLGPPLLQPSHLPALAPEILTVALSAAGLVVVIAGKVTLGRSFGLMPANRGVVSSGAYRLVRHPIYMGYLVTHLAFLLANPAGWNVLALLAADTALMARAVREEATLARDPRYRAYQGQVRWRVCPGVF